MINVMKRIVSLFVIVSLACMTCCTSHTAKSSAAESQTMPTTPTTYVIGESNWQFTLPSDGWAPMTDVSEDITRALVNVRRHNMILFVKEEFSGSYQEYAVMAIRAMEDNDLEIVSARNMMVHDRKLIVLDVISSKNSTETWTWVFYDKGFGYLLSCTGLASDSTLQDLCLGIGSTLIIK